MSVSSVRPIKLESRSTLATKQESIYTALVQPQKKLHAVNRPGNFDGQMLGMPNDILLIYQQKAFNKIALNLSHAYPTVHAILGDALFRYCTKAFIQTHLKGCASPNDQREEFAHFLASVKAADKYPYITDIALLDLGTHKAKTAADAPPLIKTGFSPSRMQLIQSCSVDLHPSVHWLASAHPVFTVWQQQAAIPYSERRHLTAENVVICRPELSVQVDIVNPGYMYFLDALEQGHTIGVASKFAKQMDNSFNLPLAIRWMLAKGLVCQLIEC